MVLGAEAAATACGCTGKGRVEGGEVAVVEPERDAGREGIAHAGNPLIGKARVIAIDDGGAGTRNTVQAEARDADAGTQIGRESRLREKAVDAVRHERQG